MIESNLPNGFKAEIDSDSIILTKKLVDEETIAHYRKYLPKSGAKLTPSQVEELIETETEEFYLDEVKDFLVYLDTIFYTNYYLRKDDSTKELKIYIRVKTNSIKKIEDYTYENLAYLNDIHPFKLDISHAMSSSGFYNCIVIFDDRLYYDDIKDYIIPFLEMVDAELSLYLNKISINFQFVDIYDLENYENKKIPRFAFLVKE